MDTSQKKTPKASKIGDSSSCHIHSPESYPASEIRMQRPRGGQIAARLQERTIQKLTDAEEAPAHKEKQMIEFAQITKQPGIQPPLEEEK